MCARSPFSSTPFRRLPIVGAFSNRGFWVRTFLLEANGRSPSRSDRMKGRKSKLLLFAERKASTAVTFRSSVFMVTVNCFRGVKGPIYAGEVQN